MTREEAIKVLAKELAIETANGHQRFVDAFNLAIAALREQEKRSKECYYCKDSARMTVSISNKLVDGVNSGWIGGNWPATFCPKCGRRLEEV